MLGEGGYDTTVSTPDWGGFITWAGNGDLKPVIDDRNTLLGEQPYRDYFEGIKSSEALIAWAQNQNADAILLPKKIGLTLNQTPTYEDANSIVIWIKREF